MFQKRQKIYSYTTTYNYNGVAYNGSGGVSPSNRDIYLNTDQNSTWVTNFTQNFPMDLRGIAEVSTTEKYIAGGMLENQIVTDKVYRLSWEYTLTNVNENSIDFKVYPNPSKDGNTTYIETLKYTSGTVELFNINGKQLLIKPFQSNKVALTLPKINPGIYFLHIKSIDGHSIQKISIL